MKLSTQYHVALHYHEKTANQLSLITGESANNIHEYARRFGIKKIPNWSNFETNFLIIFGAKTTSEYLNRSLASCKTKLSRWRSTNCTGKLQSN